MEFLNGDQVLIISNSLNESGAYMIYSQMLPNVLNPNWSFESVPNFFIIVYSHSE